jgi:hypothetical protein
VGRTVSGENEIGRPINLGIPSLLRLRPGKRKVLRPPQNPQDFPCGNPPVTERAVIFPLRVGRTGSASRPYGRSPPFGVTLAASHSLSTSCSKFEGPGTNVRGPHAKAVTAGSWEALLTIGSGRKTASFHQNRWFHFRKATLVCEERCRTCVAAQRPPRAVRMPRASSCAAIPP